MSDLVIAAKEKKLELLKEKASWIKKHRIYFYQPLPAQAEFHASTAHIRLAHGTNRSGKTTAGVCEDVALALGFRPWLLPDELKSKPIEELVFSPSLVPDSCKTPIKTPSKVLIIVEDWDVADDVLITGTIERAGKLTTYLPEEAILKSERNSLGYLYQFTLINGSIIRIDTEKSFINNPRSFEGGDWDAIHYDEPKRRDLRVALKRGLVDRYGYEMFTLTPLTEPWVFHEIYKKANLSPEIEAFFFDAEKNPYISKEGWRAFVDSLHEHEKEPRAYGRWVFLKGLVYPEFSAKHVKDGGNVADPLEPDWVHKNCSVYLAVDPHSRQPQTALFAAVDKEGRIILFDEIFKRCLISELCDLIKSKLRFIDSSGKTKEYYVAGAVIDPIAFIEDPVTGLCWADEFALHGLVLDKSSKAREQGIVEVRQALATRQLLICSNCTETIREIQSYVYTEWKDPSRSEREKPADKDDHLMECLYRIVLLKPRYVEPLANSRPIEPKKEWCP